MAAKAQGSINSTDLANVVRIDATNNGFTNGSNGIAVTVCRPAVDFSCPSTYTYTAGNGAVKVSIPQAKDTFFAKILSFNSMTVGASAVAATSNTGGNTTNIVIPDTNCDTGLTVSGGDTLSIGGSIYVNACGADAAKVGVGGYVNAAGGTFIGCSSFGGACGGGTFNTDFSSIGGLPALRGGGPRPGRVGCAQ